MKVITNRDMIADFFKQGLGLHNSEDLRGMCFFADEDVTRGLHCEDVAVAVAFNGFIGQIAQMHVVIQKPEKLTRRMVQETFRYAFETCGLVAVFGLVDSTNAAAIEFDTRLGFKEITRIKDGGLDGDFILFQMNKADCRWLGVKNGQEKRTARA